MEGKCLGEMLRGGGPVPGRGPVFSPKITMDMEKGVLGVKMFDLGVPSCASFVCFLGCVYEQ